MNSLRFDKHRVTRTRPDGLDVVTTLAHFAIITLYVDPEHVRLLVPPRFALDCVSAPDGSQQALVSVVPFLDRDFHFVRFPYLKWCFAQTNYRAYVTDTQTGEHVVWFFGTTLSSIYVNLPRFLWRLPWHGARTQFDAVYDAGQRRYTHYQLHTRSRWAPAQVALEDSGQPPHTLAGFPDLESGLVLLTHPLRGYYYRSDGCLGCYQVWHERLHMTHGHLTTARFHLLERLGLVSRDQALPVHSVLLQPAVQFTIYLPPFVAD